MELHDLHPHVDTQGGIEIGQRFVEQEALGLPDDGAADGDALALPARELPRLAIEIRRSGSSVAAALATLASISSFGMPAILRPKAMLLRTLMCG